MTPPCRSEMCDLKRTETMRYSPLRTVIPKRFVFSPPPRFVSSLQKHSCESEYNLFESYSCSLSHHTKCIIIQFLTIVPYTWYTSTAAGTWNSPSFKCLLDILIISQSRTVIYTSIYLHISTIIELLPPYLILADIRWVYIYTKYIPTILLRNKVGVRSSRSTRVSINLRRGKSASKQKIWRKSSTSVVDESWRAYIRSAEPDAR